MSLDPVFLVGSGRCGSSIMAHILSRHPDLSFLTPAAARYPHRPLLNRWMLRLLAVPGAGRAPADLPSLQEAYSFWEHYAEGFSNPGRDLTGQDVTERKKRALQAAVPETMIGSRPRFFAKITGWSRIGYLKAIFPDARFVHVVRDGRDVASSMLHVPFWDGWKGPSSWRYGRLSEEDRRIWEEHDRSFVVLAGLAWKILVGSVEEGRARNPGSVVHDVRYEDFIDRPVQVLKEICEKVDLDWSREVRACLARTDLHDSRGRHREDLREDQADRLTEVLGETLGRYGYEASV